MMEEYNEISSLDFHGTIVYPSEGAQLKQDAKIPSLGSCFSYQLNETSSQGSLMASVQTAKAFVMVSEGRKKSAFRHCRAGAISGT